jgi:hypothetical protein
MNYILIMDVLHSLTHIHEHLTYFFITQKFTFLASDEVSEISIGAVLKEDAEVISLGNTLLRVKELILVSDDIRMRQLAHVSGFFLNVIQVRDVSHLGLLQHKSLPSLVFAKEH